MLSRRYIAHAVAGLAFRLYLLYRNRTKWPYLPSHRGILRRNLTSITPISLHTDLIGICRRTSVRVPRRRPPGRAINAAHAESHPCYGFEPIVAVYVALCQPLLFYVALCQSLTRTSLSFLSIVPPFSFRAACLARCSLLVVAVRCYWLQFHSAVV
jgi:hypothetical protein